MRNYATDAETRKIVDNTDIFLIPSNNPDGANYSFYNFASQRRNMTNHCPDANADPARRNAWGVDLNRNYTVASGFDGYDGASTSCIERHLPGPGRAVRAREQEHRLARPEQPQHQVHDVRALQRRPAVLAAGRVHRERPRHHAAPADGPRGASTGSPPSRILSQVRAERQTVVTPENVGGSADVLYSQRRQRARGAVLQLRRLRVRLGGRRLGLPHGHRQLRGRLVPAGVGRQPGHRLRPQRDDGVRQRRDGDVPDRRRLGRGQDRRRRRRSPRRASRTRPRACTSRSTSRRPSTTRWTARRRRSSRRATSRPSSASRARSSGSSRPPRSGGSRSTRRATSRPMRSATVQIGETGAPGGTVPATLSLGMGPNAQFGAFTPGVAQGLHGDDDGERDLDRR